MKPDKAIIFLQFIQDNYFENSFFPSTIYEWDHLDCKVRSSSLSIFKKNLLNVIRPCENSIFNIHNSWNQAPHKTAAWSQPPSRSQV